MTRRAPVAVFPALAAVLLLGAAGCTRESPDMALEAAIVPGADLSGSVDYRSAFEAPAMDLIDRSRLEGKGGGDGGHGKLVADFEEATGLRKSNLSYLRFSADLDGIPLRPALRGEDLAGLDAVAALVFDRAVTDDQLEAGIAALAAGNGVVISGESPGGRKIVSVTPASADTPPLHASLSRDGRAVFLAFSAESLTRTHAREEGGGEPLPAPLEKAERDLKGDSQFKAAFVLPEPLRGALRKAVEEAEGKAGNNPGVAMLLGLVAPFRELAGLTVGTRLGEGVNVEVEAELGGENEAVQAATILQTVMVPMLKARIARQYGGKISDFDGSVAVGTRGKVVRLTVDIDGKTLKNLL